MSNLSKFPCLIIACLTGFTAFSAQASVNGPEGAEIEGARDRRGFYIGPSVGFGVAVQPRKVVGDQVYGDRAVPTMRIGLAFGGGVARRLTLGVDLHVTPYLQSDAGVAFGGDIEATGYVFRGLFLRVGVGAMGVPRPEASPKLTAGIGGLVGLGYEFFLNQTWAMAVAANYDIRYMPGYNRPLHTPFVGLRFTWY